MLPAPWPLDAVPPGVAHPGACRTVVEWVREYLARPHGELGRPGPVCPYVPGALAHRGLRAAVWPDRPSGVGEVITVMRAYRDWFTGRGGLGGPGGFTEGGGRSSPAADRRRAALLVLFPALTRKDLAWSIEGAQRALKTEFVEQGLMVGEFHDGPPAAPGLWNRDFRPLRSPVPLLAIRAMVRSDLPFLLDDARQLAAHQARFGATCGQVS
ncbi:DUF6875 domain-containing protein [Streptomyces sp. NPDC049837]|uniref:DUF6875 domain-containing protein n=1 Tax=Streptomyces sp. NPDC049837 TaxID=3155277 RepID=UPI00342B35C9